MSEPKTFAEIAIWKTGFDKGILAAQEFLELAKNEERERIINLLIELKTIRRDALGELVAFNTDGTKVIYLEGLEG